MLPNDIYMGIVYDSLRIMGEKPEDFYINIKPKCGYNSIIQGDCFTTYGEVVEDWAVDYSTLTQLCFYSLMILAWRIVEISHL